MALGGVHEMVISVDGEADAPFADRLNARLRALGSATPPRVTSPLRFAAAGDQLLASAELQGNDGDLAIHLRALQQLSAEHPDRTFRVDFGAPPELRIVGGSFGKHGKRVSSFLNLCVARVSLTLPPSEGAVFRETLERELAKLRGMPEFTFAEDAKGMTASALLDSTVRQTARVLGHLCTAWQIAGAESPERQPSLLRLEGPAARAHELVWLAEWVEVIQPFRLAVVARARADA